MIKCSIPIGGSGLLTTYNHSGVATVAMVLTQDSPIEIKLLVCGGLALSHLVLDAMPHRHWAGLTEQFVGLIVMPVIFSIFFHLNFGWLMLYAISASALDFLVKFKIGWAQSINHYIHRWEGSWEVVDQIYFEGFETFLIFCFTFLAWGGST